MPFLSRYRIPLILALLKFVLPYLLQHPVYELHRDEYLYLAEGNHLAWGFMEIPPLLSVFAKASLLLGGQLFWVKCWPSLLGALTLWFTCLMVMEMGGKAFAQCIAGWCMIAGVYLRVHFLFQPNFLEIFWWTLTAYFLVKHLNTQKPVYIVAAGIAIGLAWMSKYSILFFVAGILAGCILTSNRTWLVKKHLYLAAACALAIAFPNLVWQYSHQWPVVHHMKELRETQLVYISPAAFLKDQLLMHLPYFFVWTGGLAWLLFYRAGKPYRMLAWMYLTVILLLILSSGKNYYSLGAYPMLFAAGSVWFEKLTAGKLLWMRYAAATVTLALFLPFVPVALPVWKPEKLAAFYRQTGLNTIGIAKWEDQQEHPLPQDFADMLGWKEMAEKVTKAYASLPDSIQRNTLIYCRNYGQAGAISFYGKHLPRVNSDNGSFLLWMPDHYQVKTLLFIGWKVPDSTDIVFQQFARYRVVDSIQHPFAREQGTKIILFENGNAQVSRLIENGIREKKDVYRR